jgi:hypothetical protein
MAQSGHSRHRNILSVLDKSGQRSAQALNAPVVNDPISDTGWALLARRPPVSYAPNYWS